MPQWTLRLPDELAQDVEKTAKERGFANPRAFIRDAIRKELRTRPEAADALEARIAATIERLTREVRKLASTQQAQFALTDALAKAFFVCVPEPPTNVIDQARNRAMARYDKFFKSVAAAMSGPAEASVLELIDGSERK